MTADEENRSKTKHIRRCILNLLMAITVVVCEFNQFADKLCLQKYLRNDVIAKLINLTFVQRKAL